VPPPVFSTATCPDNCLGNGNCTNVTIPQSCTDLTLDGNETDVDCGGNDCAPCTLGKRCRGSLDCASQICNNVTNECDGNAFYNTGGNVTQKCVCLPGFSGSNCGVAPIIPPTNSVVILAAEVSAAALAGIIIAILLCVALAGGGGYAVYNKMGDGGEASINSNPLYKGAGNGGDNPLFKN